MPLFRLLHRLGLGNHESDPGIVFLDATDDGEHAGCNDHGLVGTKIRQIVDPLLNMLGNVEVRVRDTDDSAVREVIERLIGAGQWRDGDLDVLVVLDAGYDAPRIAHLLADLPIEVLGRLRSDRVMRKPVPVPWIWPPQGGRPPKHGGEFVFGRPETWGEVAVVTVTDTERYGTATTQAWDRLRPRLTRRAAWGDHEGPLPIIESTVIRLTVAQLPSGGVNKSVWLWCSRTGARPEDVDRYWHAFLRRFDVEHTFRLLKQTLGWTRPSAPGVQEPAREGWHTSSCTETHPARPRPPTGLEKPAGRHPLRGRTSPRHRRVLPQTSTPQGRHQTPENWSTGKLSCQPISLPWPDDVG